MGRMDGKVALITGGARGMGRSHALTLAREGADILVLDCPPDVSHVPYALADSADLERTVLEVEAEGRRIIAVEGDVRSSAGLDELVARGIAEFGGVDICIANAAIWSINDFWRFDDEEWKEVIDVNLNGIWRTAKAVAPHMIEREAGSIILISSIAGNEGVASIAHYAAAKHGVLGLMKSICLELGPPYGIRCNAILPGNVDTPMLKWRGALDFMAGGEGLGSIENLEEGTKSWAALKGQGLIDPQSVSDAMTFLASDASRDVSGLELLVDAGHHVLNGVNLTAISDSEAD
jgi:SDR family mycofactocin-dependent oxidoreductase